MRPADPDTTGGFYQPVRATWQTTPALVVAFALERITCPLANAPTDIASAVRHELHPQQEPGAGRLVFDPAGAARRSTPRARRRRRGRATVSPGKR